MKKLKIFAFVLFFVGLCLSVFRGHCLGKWVLLFVWFSGLPLVLWLSFHFIRKVFPKFEKSISQWTSLIGGLLPIFMMVFWVFAMYNLNEYYQSYLLSKKTTPIKTKITNSKIVENKHWSGRVLLFDYSISGSLHEGRVSTDLTNHEIGDSINIIVSEWDNTVYKVVD